MIDTIKPTISRLIILSGILIFLGLLSLYVNYYLTEKISYVTATFIFGFVFLSIYIYVRSALVMKLNENKIEFVNPFGKVVQLNLDDKIELSINGFFIFKTVKISSGVKNVEFFSVLYRVSDLGALHKMFKIDL